LETVFELGRFGDRRLEKGGLFCTVPWLNGRVPASVGWRVVGAVRFSSTGFCAMSG